MHQFLPELISNTDPHMMGLISGQMYSVTSPATESSSSSCSSGGGSSSKKVMVEG